MALGATHRFEDTESGNVSAANLNSLDIGLNVFQSPSLGGRYIEVSAGEIIDGRVTPPARVTIGATAAFQLPAGVTSYVYVDPTNLTVTSQTGSFPTTEHIPLAEVTCDSDQVQAIDVRRAPLALSPQDDPAFVYRSGIIYPGWLARGNTTLTPAADTLIAWPLPIIRRVSIDRFYLEVDTGGTGGGTGQLMIYDEDTANPGLPGALVEDLGTQLVDSSGVITYTPAASVVGSPGRKFLAYSPSVADAILVAHGNDQYGRGFIGADANLVPYGLWNGGAHTSGSAAPDPFPGSPTPATGPSPYFGFRVA